MKKGKKTLTLTLTNVLVLTIILLSFPVMVQTNLKRPHQKVKVPKKPLKVVNWVVEGYVMEVSCQDNYFTLLDKQCGKSYRVGFVDSRDCYRVSEWIYDKVKVETDKPMVRPLGTAFNAVKITRLGLEYLTGVVESVACADGYIDVKDLMICTFKIDGRILFKLDERYKCARFGLVQGDRIKITFKKFKYNRTRRRVEISEVIDIIKF